MAETTDKPVTPVTQDILSKYRRPGQAPASATASKKEGQSKTAYVPYRLSKETKRHLELRVLFPTPSNNPLNSMITNVHIEWRKGLGVTVVYGKTMSVEIKGQNLQELAQAIKDWKVDFIEAYNPRVHLPFPDDKTVPFVKSIEIVTPKTLQEDELPPMNQRH